MVSIAGIQDEEFNTIVCQPSILNFQFKFFHLLLEIIDFPISRKGKTGQIQIDFQSPNIRTLRTKSILWLKLMRGAMGNQKYSPGNSQLRTAYNDIIMTLLRHLMHN